MCVSITCLYTSTAPTYVWDALMLCLVSLRQDLTAAGARVVVSKPQRFSCLLQPVCAHTCMFMF